MSDLGFQPDMTHLVDVMTAAERDAPLGYRLGGFRAGPSLVVTGCDRVAEAVFDRLLAVPTLAWMRGRLTLIFMDRLDGEAFDELEPSLPVDQTIILPHDAVADDMVTAAYWMVLRACTQLGMIDGRGVSWKGVRHA
ncbi:hypothetical protein [Yoonia sp. 2307UL14-13]|uniref:hypothetical protein n=1 Tax=Yoonia sp. 2307UL14-13 TaxID=3126506 RepID=UPI003099C7F6